MGVLMGSPPSIRSGIGSMLSLHSPGGRGARRRRKSSSANDDRVLIDESGQYEDGDTDNHYQDYQEDDEEGFDVGSGPLKRGFSDTIYDFDLPPPTPIICISSSAAVSYYCQHQASRRPAQLDADCYVAVPAAQIPSQSDVVPVETQRQRSGAFFSNPQFDLSFDHLLSSQSSFNPTNNSAHSNVNPNPFPLPESIAGIHVNLSPNRSSPALSNLTSESDRRCSLVRSDFLPGTEVRVSSGPSRRLPDEALAPLAKEETFSNLELFSDDSEENKVFDRGEISHEEIDS